MDERRATGVELVGPEPGSGRRALSADTVEVVLTPPAEVRAALADGFADLLAELLLSGRLVLTADIRPTEMMYDGHHADGEAPDGTTDDGSEAR